MTELRLPTQNLEFIILPFNHIQHFEAGHSGIFDKMKGRVNNFFCSLKDMAIICLAEESLFVKSLLV